MHCAQCMFSVLGEYGVCDACCVRNVRLIFRDVRVCTVRDCVLCNACMHYTKFVWLEVYAIV
jgi:hypothetical protein